MGLTMTILNKFSLVRDSDKTSLTLLTIVIVASCLNFVKWKSNNFKMFNLNIS